MKPMKGIPPVTHDPIGKRFEIRTDGCPAAFLHYLFVDEFVIFEHTFVPVELRGQGLAVHLVRAALGEARQRQWRVVPRCDYVADFITRHPEFSDLIDPE